LAAGGDVEALLGGTASGIGVVAGGWRVLEDEDVANTTWPLPVIVVPDIETAPVPSSFSTSAAVPLPVGVGPRRSLARSVAAGREKSRRGAP